MKWLRRAFGQASSTFHVVPYRGYGNGSRALVLGRALRHAPLPAPQLGNRWWRNALDSWQRIEADPLPHARIRLQHAASEHEVVADDEGFLHTWIPLDPDAGGKALAPVTMTIDHPAAHDTPTVAEILLPSPHARFGVISDLDDTVLQSKMGSNLRAARLLLFENALTRLPFPGVAAFYRALAAGASQQTDNPLFYVSGSPWNQYEVIDAFLAAQRIPIGPVLLRDWDVGRALLQHRAYKLGRIREILATYDSLPFILIGDSTQEDPEIYAEVVHDYPNRILAVYIRNVFATLSRAEAIQHLAAEVKSAGSALVLADDTEVAAKHALLHGWIDPGALDEITDERREDTGAKPGKAPVPGAPPAPNAPTVVVDASISSSEKRSL